MLEILYINGRMGTEEVRGTSIVLLLLEKRRKEEEEEEEGG